MSKKKKPKKKIKLNVKIVISPEEQRKWSKAIEREIRLELGNYSPTTVHQTSKKDKESKKSNTIKDWKDE